MKKFSFLVIVTLTLFLLGFISTGFADEMTPWKYGKDFTPKEHLSRSFDCSQCHDENIQRLKPKSHSAGNWLKTHGKTAFSKNVACAACHATSFCSDCHAADKKPSTLNPARVDRNYPHRQSWEESHGQAAASNRLQCLICHRVSQCNTCHQGAQAATDKFTDEIHPPDFMNKQSKNFHGEVVRRNPILCASCHDPGKDVQNAICVECHRSGLFNPHPDDWRDQLHFSSSVQHENHSVCLACHSEDNLCTICHGEGGEESGSFTLKPGRRAVRRPVKKAK